MTARNFRLLDSAEVEANAAFDWYESELAGLGDAFRGEVKLTLDRIKYGPLHFGIVHRLGIRRARLDRFPYSIYFRLEDEAIVILAIFHEKRDPAIWHRRIG